MEDTPEVIKKILKQKKMPQELVEKIIGISQAPTHVSTDFFHGHPSITEKWKIGDKLHRIGGCALVSYNSSSINYEHWCFEGELHREGGPAITMYDYVILLDGDGKRKELWYKELEIWYRFNKKHCTDGPAEIHYCFRNGEVVKQEELWFIDGVGCKPQLV
jgi:hypothetical protein